MTFSIKVVAERTGVSVYALRQWERRYGIPSPHRAGNRYRLYAEKDIADVLAIKRQIENGVAPAQASAWLRQHPQGLPVAAGASDGTRVTQHQSALENAFSRSDEPLARQLLDEAFALYPIEQVTAHIIRPAMQTVGTRWMRGELNVAAEHLASNLVRQKLITLLHAQGTPSQAGPRLVAANAPEEEHELGLLILAMLGRREGWQVTYLGQRTPLTEMVRQAHEQKASAVVVSVSTVLGLASLIPWLANANRPNLPLAFGGQLLDSVPILREHMPGLAPVDDAFAALRRLPGTHPTPKVWTPSAKSLKAAMLLCEYRVQIASETADQLSRPKRKGALHFENLTQPTLFLTDTLACAIAFDAPVLIDTQREWLSEAMPVRGVQTQMLDLHLEAFKRTIEKSLGKAMAKSVDELVDRLKR